MVFVCVASAVTAYVSWLKEPAQDTDADADAGAGQKKAQAQDQVQVQVHVRMCLLFPTHVSSNKMRRGRNYTIPKRDLTNLAHQRDGRNRAVRTPCPTGQTGTAHDATQALSPIWMRAQQAALGQTDHTGTKPLSHQTCNASVMGYVSI